MALVTWPAKDQPARIATEDYLPLQTLLGRLTLNRTMHCPAISLTTEMTGSVFHGQTPAALGQPAIHECLRVAARQSFSGLRPNLRAYTQPKIKAITTVSGMASIFGAWIYHLSVALFHPVMCTHLRRFT